MPNPVAVHAVCVTGRGVGWTAGRTAIASRASHGELVRASVLLSQTPAGRAQIQSSLGLCDPVADADAVTQIAFWLLNAWDTM